MIKYYRDTLTSKIINDSLKSKNMEIKTEKHDKKSGKILMMKGGTQFRQNSLNGFESGDKWSINGGNQKGKDSSRSKSMTKCYECGNMGHFMKDCYKVQSKERDEVNVLCSTSVTDNDDVYMIISSIAHPTKLNLTDNSNLHEWIHRTYKRTSLKICMNQMIDMLYYVIILLKLLSKLVILL